MTVLLWSLAAWGSAFAVHLLIWRIRLPRRQTRALLAVFLGWGAAVVATLAAWSAAWPGARHWLPVSLPELAHVALFHLAATLAYMITYSALEADSPTLVMITAIKTAGPGGMDAREFHRTMTDDLLVRPRLRDLLRDRLAVVESGRYRITPKGRRLARLLAFHRRLLGAQMGG